ncbi:MAG: ketose-bisphosphate aldolase [Rickettsiales bacterium]|nr:ketose-bisphosphate aldolase [Rickettsiales bacterium]
MKNILKTALEQRTAIPAFNIYNLEGLQAVLAACAATGKIAILAMSGAALNYADNDFASFATTQGWMHLDHGKTPEICKHAISLGFKSVMIDGSSLPFEENAALTKQVVETAHKSGVFVEAELGTLCGIEDDISNAACTYTDPQQAEKFVKMTGCDSLAIAIGTSHGAFKMKPGDTLRFDILEETRQRLPETPLVLHGASQIPQQYAEIMGLENADGIPAEQIARAVKLGINKVNVDSDARLAWCAAMKAEFSKNLKNFDPRHYLTLAREEMKKQYIAELSSISI